MSFLEQKLFSFNGIQYNLWIYVDKGRNIWFKLKELFILLNTPTTAYLCESYKLLWTDASLPFNWHVQILEKWQDDENPTFTNEAGVYQLLMQTSSQNIINEMHEWISLRMLPVARDITRNIRSDRMYLYVATTQPYHRCNIYRIGATIDLYEELVELNESSIEDFYYAATVKVTEGKKIEKLLHLYYAPFRLIREFFTLSIADLLEFCNICKKFEYILLTK